MPHDFSPKWRIRGMGVGLSARGLRGRRLAWAPVVPRVNTFAANRFRRGTFFRERPPGPRQMRTPMSLCFNGMKKGCLPRCILREVVAWLLLVAERAAVCAACRPSRGRACSVARFLKGGGPYGPVARWAAARAGRKAGGDSDQLILLAAGVREAEKARCPSLSMAVRVASHCPLKSR